MEVYYSNEADKWITDFKCNLNLTEALDKQYVCEGLTRLASDAICTGKLLECGVELCAEINEFLKGVVREIIYDPRRNAPISSVEFKDPNKYKKVMQTFIAAEGMSTGQFFYSGKKFNGDNVLPIQSIAEVFKNGTKGTGFGPKAASEIKEQILHCSWGPVGGRESEPIANPLILLSTDIIIY